MDSSCDGSLIDAARWYPALARALSEHGLPPDLRTTECIARWVMSQKANVALRELGGEEIAETSRTLSDIADASVQEALRRSALQHAPELLDVDGVVRGVVLLGMGKLSGHELNPSSDVDLVALYDPHQIERRLATQKGPQRVEQIVRETIRQLELQTEFGQAWRVDMRLRPEGARGALAHSLAAAQRYLEVFGRVWERAAYLRARPVAGDLALGQGFLEDVAPWIWRRSVDPRVGQELARMVLQSRVELQIDAVRDLKLGFGGIREIEFFVQGLQLVWGGRHPELRHTGTLNALSALQRGGWVSEQEATLLTRAWEVLRRMEHDVQFRTMRQLHERPPAERMARLALAAGCSSDSELETEFARLRDEVHRLFMSFLPGISESRSRAYHGVRRWVQDGDAQALAGSFLRGGYSFPERLAESLVTLARRPTDPFGATTAQGYPELQDDLFDEILASASPAASCHALASMFRMWRDPTWLTSQLASQTEGRRRLIAAVGASDFLAELVCTRPERLVHFLRASRAAAEPAEQQDSTTADDEEFVAQERRRKTLDMLEIGAREASGMSDLATTLAQLSASAERSVLRAFERVQKRCGATKWVVIGAGKLAGAELGYASDLDLFFVYDDDAEQAPTYARQVQQALRLLGAHDAEGRGYELDMRLRPSGTQGPLITSLGAFEAYYLGKAGGDSAAQWQVQSLLRMRVIGGDSALARRVEQIASTALVEAMGQGQDALHALRRTRLQDAQSRHAALLAKGAVDLKHGLGGLADFEHGVQRLAMFHGVRGVAFFELLQHLRGHGVLSVGDAEGYASAYAFLRQVEIALQLVTGRAETLLVPHAAATDRVCQLLVAEGVAEAKTQAEVFARLGASMTVGQQLWGRNYEHTTAT